MTQSANIDSSKITVLGSGAWGGTLAWLLSLEGKNVVLWGRDKEKQEKIASSRSLDDPVTVNLPSNCHVTSSIDEALDKATIVLFACTSQSMSKVAQLVAEQLKGMEESELPYCVSVVKGLESNSLKRMTEVILEKLPRARVLSLSGPNLAFEIRSGLPAASVIAHTDLKVAEHVQSILSTRKFRLYASNDLAGVELGGTLKNVIAIAAGASDGLELGVNAKSALLTRGLAEMVRLATTFGAHPSTLFGLSGMGDLIATCQGPLSRNYRVGQYLAQNLTLDETLEKVGSVAEGVKTTYAVCELSKKNSIELPIAFQVQDTLNGITTPKESIMILMGRPLAKE